MSTRERILVALRAGPLTTEQVREAVAEEYRPVYQELHRMRGERLLQSKGRGVRAFGTNSAKMLVWRIRPEGLA